MVCICTCECIHGCVLIHVCAHSGDFVCIYVLGVQIVNNVPRISIMYTTIPFWLFHGDVMMLIPKPLSE